ncbi:MAG: NF038104 family lipoprotein [Gammaproteobacteria bacterium]|nr:NF038104 family lipoprotein [Gammaproteobacteria bacterium]MDP2141692.1 NF038104 family lipoprotein [Gammaproteobacteria bacterium]MDP2347927.1 NF038104 family lipoprotein [Gammaproteobacteria bacterium]
MHTNISGNRIWQKVLLLPLLSVLLQGCLGTVVGAAVDVTLEVAKVPFKVAGAVVDVATPDDDDD